MTQLKLSFLLTIFMSMVGVKALAYDAKIDGIYYNFKGTEATVTYLYSYENKDAYKGSVVIPESIHYNGKNYNVTSIGDRAFGDCRGLTSITIPNSVTNIDGYAFYGCSGLTSIDIPNNVTSIGREAFFYCTGLTSITIPKSVTSIGRGAFYGCSGLTSVIIPNSVTSIGDYAFYYCTGLISVTIGNSVTSIGEEAFYGCTSLATITFAPGSQLMSIGIRAFYRTAWYDNQPDGLVFAGKVVYMYKGTMPANTSLEIEDGTLGIATGAFSGCRGLTSVTIPNSVTSIGKEAFLRTAWYDNKPDGLVYAGKVVYMYKGTIPATITIDEGTIGIANCAFEDCSVLTSIDIPNSVTSIGNNAFYGCSSLTSVTIPNSVTSIGSYAFSDCSGLTSVSIGNSVTTIGDYAFSHCTGLTSINVESGNTTYDSRNNCNAIIETATNTLLLGCQNTVIPNSVTSIGAGAFQYCSGLLSITIPNSVTSIGSYAFGRSGLTSIIIPNSVTSIGRDAFYECRSLTSVTIPNSVTSIHVGTFCDCSGLTSVTIPNSVTSIEYCAFFQCARLTSITIPNSVTSIGEDAFQGCFVLTSVTIPNSVTSIGRQAFARCNELASVTVEWTEPISINSYTFSNRANATLYVPKGSKSVYKAAAYWNGFKDIVEMHLPTHKLNYMVDGEEYKSYDIEEGESITPETAPTKEGYTFSGWSEIPETMPAHDVTVTGTFAINQYTITYKIDDEVYQTESVDYGSTITPPNAPEREGYTFEWIDVPETMPAHDITIIGSYTSGINAIRMEAENGKVFDLNGRQVKTPGKGVYIINGRKVVVK